jgi:hypothetical protein
MTSLNVCSTDDNAHHAPLFIPKALREIDPYFPLIDEWDSLSQNQCYFTLLGWYTHLHNIQLGNSDPKSRRLRVTLQATMFRWLCLPRTIAQMRSVSDAGCTCSTAGLQDGLHVAGYTAFTDDKQQLSTPGQVLISYCLIPLVTGSLAMPTVTLKSQRICLRPKDLEKNSSWPCSFDDLFPYGVETTTRTMLLWTAVNSSVKFSTLFLSGLERWIFHTLSLSRPWILNSPTFALNSCRVIQSAVRVIRTEEQQHARDGSLEVEAVHDQLTCMIKVTSILADIIMGSVDPLSRMFISHYPEELLASCDQAHESLDIVIRKLAFQGREARVNLARLIPMYGTARDSLARIGGKIYDLVPQLQDRCQVSHGARLAFMNNTWDRFWSNLLPTSSTSEWLHIIIHLGMLHKNPYCDNVYCPRTSADAGVIMRICGGCQRVQYCSSVCQRQSWKAEIVPHKELCNHLRLVCSQLGISKKTFQSRVIRECTYLSPKQLARIEQVQPHLHHALVQLLAASDYEGKLPRAYITSGPLNMFPNSTQDFGPSRSGFWRCLGRI